MLRQDSVEMPDQDWTFISPSSLPPRSLTPEPHMMASNELNATKTKKEKKKFSSMFRRHKKNKGDKHQLDTTSLTDNLSVSIGTMESQQSFSSRKLKRHVNNRQLSSYLTPPTKPRRRSKSNPNPTASDNDDGFSDASSERDFIATLLNPSLAVNLQKSLSTPSDSLHAPAIRVRSVLCMK